ncbi:lipopolysaccharide biosynthesis protein [Salinisphaera hydrothermalis]|uniref:Membrane protein n=1 Tax=Salinisphaera hydrothermalis (strain C41B8) TaxID=1304275 RepID=A0A084IQ15_SALHC|nr:oligosaccharide flippase family protein [Salinisphaera hydrothermalis]KEZ78799.1 membrane protein [Salinisphaera hydrothermalis C41B8]
MRRAIFYTTGTQLLIQLIGLGTGVLVARLLGPDGRGALAAVISWTSMFAYLGNLGLPVAITYASARYPMQRHQLLGNATVLAACQWVFLGLLGWLVLPGALAGHGAALGNLAVLYLCAYLPLNLLTLYANAIQQGAGRYASFNAVRVSVPLGYALILLGLWMTHHIRVTTVVTANLASNALAAILALSLTVPMLLRLCRQVETRWFDRKSLRRELRYGVSAQLGTLQPFTGLRIDVLALTLLVSTHDIGLYIAALAAANLIRAQGFALGQVVLPEIAKCGNAADQWRVLRRFLLLAAGGGTLATVVVMFWAVDLLRLVYGEAFTAAALMLKILCIAGTLGALYRVIADGLRGMGLPMVSTIAELVGLTIGVVTLIVCVPTWGQEGAAYGVLAASATSLCVAVWMAFRARRIALGGGEVAMSGGAST